MARLAAHWHIRFMIRRPQLASALAVALGLFAGCLEPVELLDAPDGATRDPSDDRDGDGLSNEEELAGWTIFIDSEAFGPNAGTAKLSARMVTSDPDLADTDGDGIDDGDEFFDRTDPRNPDSDGDRLDDFAEKFRWKTNAKSVDSDGDARGDGSQFPRAQLYDGAELDNGTSPSFADTDGDGRDDYQETITDTEYDPRIAELPRAVVSFAGPVDMRLFVEYEDAVGTSVEYGSSFEQETSTSQSRSDMRSTTTTVKGQGAYFDGLDFSKQGAINFVGRKVLNFGVGLLPDAVADSLDINKEPTPDVATTESSTFTRAATDTSRQEYSRYTTDSHSRTERSARGEINLGITVTNAGLSSFELESLFITVLQWQPLTEDWKALATLQPVIDDSVVIAGGQHASLQVQAGNVNPQLLKEFLSNPTRLYYDAAQYSIRDADGIDFAFIVDNAYTRTALVTIDYGNGTVDYHRVATQVDRYAQETEDPDDPDKPFQLGDPAGISMKDFLKIAGVDYELTPRPLDAGDEVQVLTRVEDVENLTADGDSPFPQPRVEGVVQAPSGFWVVYAERASQAADDLDFDALVLRGGDSIRLVYVQDQDGDGLFQREETLLGSFDTDPDTGVARDALRPAPEGAGETRATVAYQSEPVALQQGRVVLQEGSAGVFDSVDSDGDGLTDFEEARGGWAVEVAGRDPFTAYSSVAAIDSDGDSLTDLQERLAGTDPAHIDTDRDTLTDGCEQAPTLPADRSPARLGWVALTGASPVNCGANAFIYVYDAGGDLAGYSVSLTTGSFELIEGSPFASNSTQFPGDIVIPNKQAPDFAYLTSNDQRVTAYTIDPDTGALNSNAVQQISDFVGGEPNQRYTRIYANPHLPAVYIYNPPYTEYLQFAIEPDETAAGYGGLAFHGWFDQSAPRGLAFAPEVRRVYLLERLESTALSTVTFNGPEGQLGGTSVMVNARGEGTLSDVATAAFEDSHLVLTTAATMLHAWRFTGTAENPSWEVYARTPLPAPATGRNPMLATSPDGRFAYVSNGPTTGFRLDKDDPADATLPSFEATPDDLGGVMVFSPEGSTLLGRHAGQMYRVASDGTFQAIVGNEHPGVSDMPRNTSLESIGLQIRLR